MCEDIHGSHRFTVFMRVEHPAVQRMLMRHSGTRMDTAEQEVISSSRLLEREGGGTGFELAYATVTVGRVVKCDTLVELFLLNL